MYLTSAQIKGKINSLAKQKGSDPISLLRIYMMERFLERLSISKYKDYCVIKGGILVTSMVGVSMRSTMDIDTTIKNFNLDKNFVEQIINEISNIELDDEVKFSIKDVTDIMDNMEYPGIRVHMNASIEKMDIPIKIDLSTGDEITPREIRYNYALLLEERSIPLWSYNLETILAEKIQTVLARGILNTRMRDFYDITTLCDVYQDTINYDILALAFDKTCIKRNTTSLKEESNEIIQNIELDNGLHNLWKQYQKKYKFAKEISFEQNIETLKLIIKKMQPESAAV